LIFIKKGGEIRLIETLATNPTSQLVSGGGERCQDLIPERREIIKINTEKMNTFLLLKKDLIMLLMPMCMCR
jgi:hypothetical protein